MASRRYWTLVGLYVLLLFAVQPFLGFGIDAFKARWGEPTLVTVVGVIGAAAGMALLVVTIRLARGLTRLDAVALALGVAAYGLGVMQLEIPQERLHYVEYGLLAGLIFVGLRERPGREAVAFLQAFAVGTALGFLDELLQGWLWPRRYFDWADVLLNLRASLVGLVIAVPLRRAWLRRRSGSPPASSA